MHDLTLALRAEDIGVLIGLAHSGRLHRVTLELTLADVHLVVLQSLRVLSGLLEVDVRLERVRLTSVVDSIMRMSLVVRM